MNNDYVDAAIDALISAARSGEDGKIGDGKFFVTELLECIRIRDGVRGKEAIG